MILQKINQLLIFLFFLLIGLVYGKPYLTPILLGAFFSMLLLPLCERLEKYKVKRIFAIIICIIIFVSFVSLLVYFVIREMADFQESLPLLELNFYKKVFRIQEFLESNLGVEQRQQIEIVNNTLNRIVKSIGSHIANVLIIAVNFIFYFVIIIVYVFLFLMFREKLKNFVLRLINNSSKEKTKVIINKITKVAQSYISGVFIVVLILSVMNTIGLMIFRIEHAIFFGVLAGFLNIIPYVGSVSGSLFPVIYAFLTKDSFLYPLGIGIMFLIIQSIESYILTPNITGAKVKLNPMATILALLLGAVVWGIIGMILFIPLAGVLKVVFDNISFLKPYGYLIGENDEKETS